MFNFKKLKTDVVTERLLEHMSATIAQQAADIDYIAMMTDVELESEANEDEAQ